MVVMALVGFNVKFGMCIMNRCFMFFITLLILVDVGAWELSQSCKINIPKDFQIINDDGYLLAYRIKEGEPQKIIIEPYFGVKMDYKEDILFYKRMGWKSEVVLYQGLKILLTRFDVDSQHRLLVINGESIKFNGFFLDLNDMKSIIGECSLE